MIMGIASFLLSKKKNIIRKKRPMRKSRKGNPPKSFCQWGSTWLGWILPGAEEILKSKYLHDMYLLWMVRVQWVWFLPAPCTQRLCPHTGVFCHIHTHFPWAQAGEWETEPHAELAKRFTSSRGACRGRSPWSCDGLRAPPVLLPQPHDHSSARHCSVPWSLGIRSLQQSHRSGYGFC